MPVVLPTCFEIKLRLIQPDPQDSASEMVVVRDLADAFLWARYCVAKLAAEDGNETLEHVKRSLAELTISTMFSGVGTPEHANLAITEAVGHITGSVQPPHIPCIWAADWDSERRAELMAVPSESKPRCIFGDVTNFLNPKVKRSIRDGVGFLTFAQLLRITMTPGAVVPEGWCYCHNAVCTLSPAAIHVVGPPCVDFSSQGSRLGLEGPAALALLCWLALRRRLEEPIIILEHVSRFPVGLLSQILGDKYDIHVGEVGPNTLGWKVQRPRLIITMLHRSKALLTTASMPWKDMASFCARTVETTWAMFFVASDAELHAE